MISINLLPHREQARKERRQQFMTMLVLVVILAGLVAAVVHIFNSSRIEAQDRDNEYLKKQISALDNDIAEIKRLSEQMAALLSRKQVIETLQSNRTETVVLFNELTKQMPEGVMLKGIKQTGLGVNFTGYSQSNARVAQLMRNLDSSLVLEKPSLVDIKATTFNKRGVGEFSLNMSIERAPTTEQSGLAKPASRQAAAAGGAK